MSRRRVGPVGPVVVDFAIQLNDTGGVAIYESGALVNTFGPYHAGDVFRVQVKDGVVTYYRNRYLLYTSARTPSYPLLLDASIRTPGGSMQTATEDTVFSLDRYADQVYVHGIDPICAAE